MKVQAITVTLTKVSHTPYSLGGSKEFGVMRLGGSKEFGVMRLGGSKEFGVMAPALGKAA
ncbi:hypothetical protein DAERI_130023 [Deinococcus aerius]|uniref:Uncharacterized protein n=1 Tax=Deinococcus aerius TaxID=200253 RepID=A0A2I9CYG4_9DEIO|nr:hypothetical protein [Deinococcus aerius]GBF07193.1 hypothetical protein DAERI_130023 [Deinococcus aerius]